MDNNKEKFLEGVSIKIKEINDLIKKYKLEKDVMASITVGVFVKNEYEDIGEDLSEFKAIYAHMVKDSVELESIHEFAENAYESDTNLGLTDWFSQN